MTTLQEVRSPQLDSVTSAQLVVLRFPVYYVFAFTLVGTTLVLSTFGLQAATSRRRYFSFVLVMLVTVVDSVRIYKPLETMTVAV